MSGTTGAAAPAANEGALIAIVDDDPSVRRALSRLLRSHGFGAVAFNSGGELLAVTGQMHFDCLLVDLRMKGMSGIDLCRQLTERGTGAPVVLITAYFDDDVQAEASLHGVIACLQKPVREETLLATLRSALQSRMKNR